MVDRKMSKYWQEIYSKKLGEIPWEIEKSPLELNYILKNDFVNGKKILDIPSQTTDLARSVQNQTEKAKDIVVNANLVLDIACGSGNYSIHLAKLGFEVTAIDISSKAIDIAREKAKTAKVKIDFINADFLDYSFGKTRFDFIFDYSLLHHIDSEDLEHYTKKEVSLLDTNGILALICYSEKDEYAEGKSSTTGKFGNVMYYRTKEEIEKFYDSLKLIHYSETTLGKRQHHKGHFWVWKK